MDHLRDLRDVRAHRLDHLASATVMRFEFRANRRFRYATLETRPVIVKRPSTNLELLLELREVVSAALETVELEG